MIKPKGLNTSGDYKDKQNMKGGNKNGIFFKRR